jgi:hypothetical protein
MKEQDKPLSTDEVRVARDIFFDVFDVVKERMADDASLDDIMKVMKEVCELGHRLRKVDEDAFGFNK